MKLKVNEIFYSLQGEGIRAGEPSIFIRLADCNMACGFCDTEFLSGKEMELDEIYDYIIEKFILDKNNNQILPDRFLWIVWTGGEPALQLNEEIVKWFAEKGFKQAIETSGSVTIMTGLYNLITLSPKVAEHVLEKNFKWLIEYRNKYKPIISPALELKYVWHAGKPGIPKPVLNADYYFLSPMFDGNKINMDNVNHCIKLCLENPKWKLSIQIHKLLNIL